MKHSVLNSYGGLKFIICDSLNSCTIYMAPKCILGFALIILVISLTYSCGLAMSKLVKSCVSGSRKEKFCIQSLWVIMDQSSWTLVNLRKKISTFLCITWLKYWCLDGMSAVNAVPWQYKWYTRVYYYSSLRHVLNMYSTYTASIILTLWTRQHYVTFN